jgi:hypothetical protein
MHLGVRDAIACMWFIFLSREVTPNWIGIETLFLLDWEVRLS